jgi:hypothetical protein
MAGTFVLNTEPSEKSANTLPPMELIKLAPFNPTVVHICEETV